MRERARTIVSEDHGQSSSEPVVEHLLRAARDDQSVYAAVLQILSALSALLEREADRYVPGSMWSQYVSL